MKISGRRQSLIRNSRGMIAADFIFSLTLCVGLSIVFFALTFTFAMSEVVQYIAFSTARAHAAAHRNPDKQIEMGQNKFNSLMNNQVFAPLINSKNGGWFLVGTNQIGSKPTVTIRNGLDGNDFAQPYGIDHNNVTLPYTGVQVTFKSRLLNLKIPFIGNTASDAEQGFTANINALLFREPTEDECWAQMKDRYNAILSLKSGYDMGNASSAQKYYPMEDNGC